MRWLALGLALIAGATATAAYGERTQRGNLIASLDGELSPLALPRDRPAPISVHLEGGLQTSDGAPLPQVTRIELGLPSQGFVSTRGLPTCSARLLHDAKPPEALAACRDALVGRGTLRAQVALPNQAPFSARARILAFNGRVDGSRAVFLHAYIANPPTVAVLPLRLGRGKGRFGKALAGNLSAALGPWPRLRHFDLTLFRRFSYRGHSRSYLSASCPIPKSLTAGFISLARVQFGLADGRRIGTAIARSCRAR